MSRVTPRRMATVGGFLMPSGLLMIVLALPDAAFWGVWNPLYSVAKVFAFACLASAFIGGLMQTLGEARSTGVLTPTAS